MIKIIMCIIIFSFSAVIQECKSNTLFDFDKPSVCVKGGTSSTSLYSSKFKPDETMIGVGLSFNYVDTNNIISFSFVHFREAFVFSLIQNKESLTQLGILYGKYFDFLHLGNSVFFRAHILGGISLVHSIQRGNIARIETIHRHVPYDELFYEEIEKFSFGIPIEFGFKIVLFDRFSTGIDFVANVNTLNTVISVYPLFTLEMGKLR